MLLIHTDNGNTVVKEGYIFKHKGDELAVTYIEKPHKPSSTGRVSTKNVKNGADRIPYFPSVYGMEWIEREDQGWEHPEVELKKILELIRKSTGIDMSGYNFDEVLYTVYHTRISDPQLEPEDLMYMHKWLKKQNV